MLECKYVDTNVVPKFDEYFTSAEAITCLYRKRICEQTAEINGMDVYS